MKDSYVFYKDKLGEEYRAVFDQVEMYVNTQAVDESIREERLGELLDIFCSAQEAGKPVQTVVGSSLERFCRSFCADFGAKNRLFYVLDNLKGVAWTLLIFAVIDLAWLLAWGEASGGVGLFQSTDWNVLTYLAAVLCVDMLVVVTNVILRRVMFRTRRVRLGLLNGILCAEAVLACAVLFWALASGGGFSWRPPTLAMAGAAGLYLLIYYPACGKRIKRQKIRLSELVCADVEPAVWQEMEKKFQKAQKRAQKRGRTLTLEEFLDREERECQRGPALYILLPLGITALCWLGLCLTDGFESPADSAAFAAVTLAAEYLVMWGLWRLARRGFAARLAWVRGKRAGPGEESGE
ncbi:MAG: DUF1048 domain-containing protein [Oscillospiraceae bacterium]|nr:DUF1048 domain-containing protein [Oscillospiraceae bacterium]